MTTRKKSILYYSLKIFHFWYLSRSLKIGRYRCEVEWSNDKKPFQITHDLKVLVAPTVKFIPSKQTLNSLTGYGKTGNIYNILGWYHCHISSIEETFYHLIFKLSVCWAHFSFSILTYTVFWTLEKQDNNKAHIFPWCS